MCVLMSLLTLCLSSLKMMGHVFWIFFICLILESKFEIVFSQSRHERNIENPVTLTSISMQTNYGTKNATRVTIEYVATKPVQFLWTIDGGFSPTALDETAITSFTNTSASVILPETLLFDDIHAHIICAEELFELHLYFDKSQFSDGIFPVDEYSFFVPPKSEIGLSSLGESQFHVFVNLTGTSFSFGMLAAEVVGRKGRKLFTHSSFSFLPDNEVNKLRLKTAMQTSEEKHFDVILRVPALHTHGGILSLLTACTTPSSVIKRMDMQQTIHIHPIGKPVVPLNFLSFVDINTPSNIFVDKSGRAIIRCKAVGNPTPSLTLAKLKDKSVGSKSSNVVHVSSYVTSLPFETTKTFQFINASASAYGQYACEAKNRQQSVYKMYTLSEA